MDDAGAVLTRHKLDVDDYYRMADAGILQPKARVELIDGEIIDMAPIGNDHPATVSGLTLALVRACGDLAIVSAQNPVRLDRLNEPQPEFAILRPRADRYRTARQMFCCSSRSRIVRCGLIARSSCRFTPRPESPNCGSWTSRAV